MCQLQFAKTASAVTTIGEAYIEHSAETAGAAPCICRAGGSAAYHREGSDLQFLTTVAAAVRELRPDALVLLTASAGVLLGTPYDVRTCSCCLAETCRVLLVRRHVCRKLGMQCAAYLRVCRMPICADRRVRAQQMRLAASAEVWRECSC